MSKTNNGTRHTLLYYRRSLDRIWKTTFLLSLVIAYAGWKAASRGAVFLGIGSELWLFSLAALVFLFSAFSFVMRHQAYIQAKSSYLKVVTPFLRFHISYRRIRSAYPALIQLLFPAEASSWSQHNFLKPFYGKTVLVVELIGYPANPNLMRLFLPGPMFSPRNIGLVFMVPDWMKLSTELDTLRGVWLQGQSKRSRSNK